MSIRNSIPKRYDSYEGCPYEAATDYYADGETMRRLWWICQRLYDESAPLRGDDQRDIAQFLDATLSRTI